MPRFKLTVAYDGTAFHGWARQREADGAAVRTVQTELEQAVRHVVREDVDVIGASRTDAGVHARCQCAAFSCARDFDGAHLADAISRKLPGDVRVVDAARVDDAFDPILDVLSKGYRYE